MSILFDLYNTLKDLIVPMSPERSFAKSISVSELHNLVTVKVHHDLQAVSAFSYACPEIKKLIWSIKYFKDSVTAQKMAPLMYCAILRLIKVQLKESGAYTTNDSIVGWKLVPIPLSTKRLRERGYSQTNMIAQCILNIDETEMMEVSNQILQKTKHTRPQSKSASKNERLYNIQGCFSVMQKEQVIGQRFILIDDVITTGATMREARKTLLDAGAAVVLGASIAFEP